MRRTLLCFIAIVLLIGVSYVAIDTTRRAATLGTFTRGMGTPDNPTREEIKTAEWNLVYLLGLSVGTVTGVVFAVMSNILWRLARQRGLQVKSVDAPILPDQS